MKKTEVLENMLDKQSIGNKNVKKIIKHSKKVRYIALEICDEINNQDNVTIISKRDQKLIKIAALFHDVKKYNCKNEKRKKHNKKGAKYIKKHGNVLLKSFSDNEKELICLMVRWHKGDGYIERDYSKEQIRMIETVRAADKISKIYRKSIEECAYNIIKNISDLQDETIKEAAAIVLFKRVKML